MKVLKKNFKADRLYLHTYTTEAAVKEVDGPASLLAAMTSIVYFIEFLCPTS